MSRARQLLTGAVYGGVGVVLLYAVALGWHCVTLARDGPGNSTASYIISDITPQYSVDLFQGWNHELIRVGVISGTTAGERVDGAPSRRLGSMADRVRTLVDPTVGTQIQMSVGWPFRCLKWTLNRPPTGLLAEGIPIGWPRTNWLSYGGRMPVVPIWSGFIPQWILSILVVAAAHRAAIHVVKVRRRRRGLCTHCAYPIPVNGGVSSGVNPAVCPECGKT